jgi:hypothetical protein
MTLKWNNKKRYRNENTQRKETNKEREGGGEKNK